VLTFFDAIKFLCGGVGALLGGVYGASFGWKAGVLCTLGGMTAGLIMGNLPFVAALAWLRFDLKRQNVATLKERISRHYYICHLLIEELMSRGEPKEQFRGRVAALLQSDSEHKKRFGTSAAQRWFPDLLEPSSAPTAAAEPIAPSDARNKT
jgi:hypothetical protein